MAAALTVAHTQLGGSRIAAKSATTAATCATALAPRRFYNTTAPAAAATPGGASKTMPDVQHFAFDQSPHPLEGTPADSSLQRPGKKEAVTSYMLRLPAYTADEATRIDMRHVPTRSIADRVAWTTIRLLRFGFDLGTGYGLRTFKEEQWLQRIIFLETVAGVPGMVGGMLRHLRSLRRLKRDYGWIHTLLEEAENERMHLLTFLSLKQPGPLFRTFVLLGQGVFFNIFMAAYLASPRTCHRYGGRRARTHTCAVGPRVRETGHLTGCRQCLCAAPPPPLASFVGYLEEEAVKTYTHCLAELDAGHLPKWTAMPAPEIARQYWQLPGAQSPRLLVALASLTTRSRWVSLPCPGGGGARNKQKQP